MTSPEMPYPAPGPSPYNEPRNGLGIASLVLGVLGVVLAFVLIGIVPAILGLILGIMGYRRVKAGEANNGGVAIAGIIVSLLGIVIAVVLTVVVTAAFNSQEFQDLRECVTAAENLDNAQDAEVAVRECSATFGENLTDG